MKKIQKIIQLDNFDGYDGETSLQEVIDKVNEMIDVLNRRKE